MKKVLILCIYVLLSMVAYTQSPQSFNYQAVVRNSLGQVIPNQLVSLRISIQQSTAFTDVYVETHQSTTNSFGLVNLEIGNGSLVSGDFSSVDWASDVTFIQIELDETGGSNYQIMGLSQLLSVPYALYANKSGSSDSSLWKINGNDIYYNQGNVGIGLNAPTSKLVVKSDSTANIDDVIFSVLNAQGDTVLAVYQEGVRIWVSDDDTSGTKATGNRGGFAVGGFSPSKATTNEYLRVTPDSVRIYIEEDYGTKASGNRGGFAVGGFSPSKSFTDDFLFVNDDSTRVWTGDTIKGFGVKNIGIGSKTSYMQMTPKNYFIGHEAGNSNVSGLYNSFLGYRSGYNNISGSKNYFFGYHAGYNNNDGSDNIFIGDSSGVSNTTGQYNIFVGNMSGLNNNSNYNLFMGYNAGYNNSAGQSNVFLGHNAGFSNIDGLNNVFIGFHAGYENTGDFLNGINNVFIGTYAGSFNTMGEGNVYIGEDAGKWASTGDNNLYIGKSAYGTASGSYNVSLGYNSRATGSSTTAVGAEAGYNSSGSNCVYLGYRAGYGNSTNNILMIENSWPTTTPLIYGDFANDRVCLHRSGTSYPFQVGNASTNGNGAYVTGGGVWTPGSSRLIKDRYTDLDGEDILNKIETMELKGWYYIGTQEYHIGPFAEDFYQAFGTGVLDHEEDLGKFLSPTDVSGVSMVAIQQLIKELNEQKKLNEELIKRIEKLESK